MKLLRLLHSALYVFETLEATAFSLVCSSVLRNGCRGETKVASEILLWCTDCKWLKLILLRHSLREETQSLGPAQHLAFTVEDRINVNSGAFLGVICTLFSGQGGRGTGMKAREVPGSELPHLY